MAGTWIATGYIPGHRWWKPKRLRDLDACCAALDVPLSYCASDGRWFVKYEHEHEKVIDRVTTLVFGAEFATNAKEGAVAKTQQEQ